MYIESSGKKKRREKSHVQDGLSASYNLVKCELPIIELKSYIVFHQQKNLNFLKGL